jgi:hypothetical protein
MVKNRIHFPHTQEFFSKRTPVLIKADIPSKRNNQNKEEHS